MTIAAHAYERSTGALLSKEKTHQWVLQSPFQRGNSFSLLLGTILL
jgi:hypothetical protein